MLLAQMAAQISAAASLSETETGREIAARSSVSNLVISGYLRTLPINPYLDEGGYPFRVLYSGDLMSSGAGLADIVFVSIGSSEGARDVCRTLNRQAGAGEEISELVMAYGTDMRSMMQRNGGCFRMHDVGIPGDRKRTRLTSELQSLM